MSPRLRFARRLTAVSCLVAITPLAVAGQPAGRARATPAGPPPATVTGGPERQRAYAAAAAEFGVPEDVLLAVSYLESRWDVNAGASSTAGGYGPMHLTDPARAAAGWRLRPPASDLRGDPSRAPKLAVEPAAASGTGVGAPAITTEGVGTLAPAAGLLTLPPETLRDDPTANIRGGAALLASYQRELGGRAAGTPPGAGDPATWYPAVARYSGASEIPAALGFADEVFAVLRAGADRITDDGFPVRLPRMAVAPQPRAAAAEALAGIGLRQPAGAQAAECPAELGCAWIPAPYQLLGDGRNPANYGNHDQGNRPRQQKITHIVLHDTEGSFSSAVNAVRNPAFVSWHYTVRSSDGYVAQHVTTKDVAWHAGNWYLNATSIGIEHEGQAADGAWYTEASYRSSAHLVHYLATRFAIPLDREHVVGHDNVPGITPSYIPSMHWDPGPYWDWERYFALLGKPITGNTRTPLPGAAGVGGLVTIKPDFATNRPAFHGCAGGGTLCPSRGSSALVLHTAPRADSPLVADVGLRPDGAASTMAVSDTGPRVSAGQRFAVAGRSGNWIAIWYLGQKAWLLNPPSAPVAVPTRGRVITPKASKGWIRVYGRAYPEASAYPAGVPVQPIVALPYRLPAGQRYSLAQVVQSEYYHAVSYDGSSGADRIVVRGRLAYAQIQLGHRFMYVNLADVRVLRV